MLKLWRHRRISPGEFHVTSEKKIHTHEIEVDFYWWEKGTYRFDIWHWFDENLPNGLAVDFNLI